MLPTGPARARGDPGHCIGSDAQTTRCAVPAVDCFHGHIVAASVIDVNPWEQLMEGIDLPFHPDLTIPTLTEVALPIPQPDPVDDVEAAAHSQVVQKLAGSVTAGMTVAVGAGSRGLVERVALLRGAISGLRELGAQPFVVPAMGSHGGATAEGQRSMLESLGMTEAAIDCEIRATMETVEVARTADGMPLYLDRNAAGADRIMPVNRIKPHTCFKGPIESGLTKMAVVGFGKQPGAAQIHACGPVEMRNRLLNGIDALKKTGRLLVVHEAVDVAGFGAEVVAHVVDQLGPSNLKAAKRLAAPRIPIPFAPPLEAEVRVTPEKVVKAVKALLG